MESELVQFIKQVIETTGLAGVCAILLYFVLKALPQFKKDIEALGNTNASSITAAITKQTDSASVANDRLERTIREHNERMAQAMDENTRAVNSLREFRREDMEKIEEIRDLTKGVYRIVEGLQKQNTPVRPAANGD